MIVFVQIAELWFSHFQNGLYPHHGGNIWGFIEVADS